MTFEPVDSLAAVIDELFRHGSKTGIMMVIHHVRQYGAPINSNPLRCLKIRIDTTEAFGKD